MRAQHCHTGRDSDQAARAIVLSNHSVMLYACVECRRGDEADDVDRGQWTPECAAGSGERDQPAVGRESIGLPTGLEAA